MFKEELKHTLYAASKSVWFCWYIWHPSGCVKGRTEYLKTPQGAFEFFIQCLLDQGVRTDLLMNRVMPRLKEAGYLNYSNLLAKLSDPERLRGELIEALGSSGYRMKNKGAKAIVKAVEVVSRRYGGDIHNIYRYANQKHDDKLKVAEEVWLELTKRGEFYWMGDKKAGVFLRDMVGYGVWDVPLEPIPPPVDVRVRRVLERLQLVKDGNDVEECRDAVLSLASELNIAPLELDVTLWIVGDENACGIKKPKHDRCPLKLYCPSKDKI